MASFWKEIEGKYGVETYQETKDTYDWLTKALYKGNFHSLIINAEFNFGISEIHCFCNGIEEFTENAYGQTEYSLTTFNLSAYSDDVKLVQIIVHSNNSISILCDSKVQLQNIVNLIQDVSLDETEMGDSISVMHIETQNNDVIIHGDNNTVANNRSSINSEGKAESESKAKQWLNAIEQNLFANGIWYILCLLFGAVITYFVKK